MVITAMVAVFLLAGCTPEVKESKQESKQAIIQTESIQKSPTVLSKVEKAYMETVSKTLQTFTDEATNVSNLMKQANQNPSIANDENWMKELQGSFMTIALTGELLREINNNGDVPERFENLHRNLQESFDLMADGGFGLIESIKNNLDMNLFNESMQTIALSNQKMIEVNEELNELNSK
jgi:hypothetical protein